MTQITRKQVGFYLKPYVWIKEYPSENKGVTIDASKAKSLVYQSEIISHLSEFLAFVYCDGLFLFEFNKITLDNKPVQAPINFQDSNTAIIITRIFNTYLALLWTTIVTTGASPYPIGSAFNYFNTFTINPREFINYEEYIDGTSSFGSDSGSDYSYSGAIWERAKLKGIIDTFQEKSSFFHRYQQPISQDVLDKSFDLLKTILIHEKANKLLVIFELLAKSYQSISYSDYDWSLMTAWVAIESALSDLWEQFIEKNKTIIDNNRKNRLKDFRSFTSSVQLEFLSFNDMLDINLFNNLHSIRKKRNDWVHDLKHPSQQDAELAISTFIEFTNLVYTLTLPNPYN